MFKKTRVCTGVLIALAGVTALPVAAQTTPSERIEVTGSRIRSLNADSPSPVQVLSAEDIQKSGAVTLQDLLLKNPTMGSPAISRTNSNFSTSSAGVAVVDLRNLGTSRTLVLVNGRRHVAGIPGETAVDLNTIPTDFIERVEILTGGASATYGSDAVAGVVNIILKKNFNGLAVDLSQGQSSKSDDKRTEFSLTMGANGADGKSNIMAHFGYTKQGAVFSNKRAPTDDISTAFLTGDPADMFNFTVPFLSSYAPQGRFFVGNTSRTYDTAGNEVAWSTNGSATAPARGFNRQASRTIAIPLERYVFSTKGELAVDDNHSAFMEATYAQTQTRTRLEPFPFDSAATHPASGGQVPAEFMVNGQMRANPLIPASLLAQMTDTDGDGARDFFFSRRLSEVGNRSSAADRDTFRVVAGAKGTIFGNWDYDAYMGYGATKESQVNAGQVNVLTFKSALESVPDLNDVDGDGDTTEAVCLDASARAQGCVPVNVFGFNSISPAALNYIQAPGLLSTFTSQRLAGATVRGDLFQLPAGPLSVAAGLEWREEYARSEFDPLQQAGLNAGNAIPRTEGQFDVTDGFIEARLPLLKDAPFAKSMVLSGAVRSGKYSTVGNTTSWTGAFEWSPVRDIRVRATQARAVRAPNINELYSPPSQTFPSVSDPCVGVTATSVGTKDSRCRAAPGVAANIAANGAFTLSQADLQGTSGFDRGNPTLKQEQGNSTTFGLVITPASIPVLKNFSFSIDYFKIKVDDAIVSTPRDFILDQCYSGDASFCQFVTRRAAQQGPNSAGSLSFVDSAVTNSGGLFTEGFDFEVAFSDKIGPGRLNSKLNYTRVSKGYVIPLRGSAPDDFAGEVGAAKDKFTLGLGYSMGPWSIASTTTYIGKSALDDQLLASFGAPKGSITVPAKTYVDFQVNYTYRKATFYVGMDNAFDTKAPRFDTNALITGGTTGAGTAADVYDAIGSRYYAGVRLQF
ncbi:TonB-dependent receptor [beta proteobacterium AAP121]|nr:TonB-dependent receptor [beta proteobacterium AAP65]KPF97987.1 TonB-dependent receptor [beta proteobacterium AAP121]